MSPMCAVYSLLIRELSQHGFLVCSLTLLCILPGKPHSSLDKKSICVNMQLKSSKKQLKLNVCVPKSNSDDRYAITCDVNAYHLVHFVSICVIYRCQSGIDFLQARIQYNSNFMNKIWTPVKYFSGKMDASNKCQQGHKICFRYNKNLLVCYSEMQTMRENM